MAENRYVPKLHIISAQVLVSLLQYRLEFIYCLNLAIFEIKSSPEIPAIIWCECTAMNNLEVDVMQHNQIAQHCLMQINSWRVATLCPWRENSPKMSLTPSKTREFLTAPVIIATGRMASYITVASCNLESFVLWHSLPSHVLQNWFHHDITWTSVYAPHLCHCACIHTVISIIYNFSFLKGEKIWHLAVTTE